MIATFQESLLFIIEGTLGKKNLLQCLKMLKNFAIFSKRVPHYHLDEGIFGG
jgi:hypothetical protein